MVHNARLQVRRGGLYAKPESPGSEIQTPSCGPYHRRLAKQSTELQPLQRLRKPEILRPLGHHHQRASKILHRDRTYIGLNDIKTQRAHFGARPDHSHLHLAEESLFSDPVPWRCYRPPSARVATILDRIDFANTVSVETKNRPVGR